LDQFAERLGVSPADRDVDELDNEDETTPGASNDGDVERGDHADASGRTDPGDRSPASTLASAALNLAGRARDLAGPVGRIVSERVDQVTGAVGDYRHLAERVERLEAE